MAEEASLSAHPHSSTNSKSKALAVDVRSNLIRIAGIPLPSTTTSSEAYSCTQREKQEVDIRTSHKHPKDLAIDFSRMRIGDDRATDLFVQNRNAALQLAGQGYNPPPYLTFSVSAFRVLGTV